MVRNVFRNMCGLITKCLGTVSGMFGNVSGMFGYFMPLLVHIAGTATKRAAPVLLIPTRRNNPRRDSLRLRSAGKIHRFWGLLFSTTWSSTIASEQALRFPLLRSSSSYLHSLEQSTYGICYLKICWNNPQILGLSTT